MVFLKEPGCQCVQATGNGREQQGMLERRLLACALPTPGRRCMAASCSTLRQAAVRRTWVWYRRSVSKPKLSITGRKALTMKTGVPGLGTSAVTWPRRLASTV